MSLFYDVVEEQKMLMKEKGYDENSLDSAERSGWFMRQLQLQFSLALNQAHRLNETIDFDIKAVGFFGRNADIVVFNFSYEYNPETLDLRIRNMSAELDKYKKSYALDCNADLPTSFKVYRELKSIKNLEEKQSRQSIIKGLIEDQELLLNELGLTHQQFHSQLDLFGDRFSSELNKHLKQNNMEEKYFTIEVKIPLSSHDSIAGDFRYKFDPSEMKLELDYILAKKGAASICFPIKKGEALPTIKRMEEMLSFEIRKQNARLISEHNPTAGGHRQRL